jgi:hypothetical protein
VKASAGTLALVLVLSLGVWTYFYLSSGPPLNASETAVVVGVCAGAVFLARWVWARLRGTKGGDDHPS